VSGGTRNRIRELRGLRGLTQSAVAGEMGVTPRTVIRWERGESAISDIQKVRLAQLLRVSVPWMMGWPEEANGNGNNGEEEAV